MAARFPVTGHSPMNASIRANHGTRRSGARVGARNFPVRESGATPLRFNALLLAAHNGNVVGHIQRESACKAAGEMDLVAPGRHGRQQCPVSIGDTFVGPRTEIQPEDIVGRRHRERTRADRAGYSKAIRLSGSVAHTCTSAARPISPLPASADGDDPRSSCQTRSRSSWSPWHDTGGMRRRSTAFPTCGDAASAPPRRNAAT